MIFIGEKYVKVSSRSIDCRAARPAEKRLETSVSCSFCVVSISLIEEERSSMNDTRACHD